MRSLIFCSDADESAILNVIFQRAGYAATVYKEMKYTPENWLENPARFILLSFRGAVHLPLIHQLRTESNAPILAIVDPVPEEMLIKLWETPLDLVVSRPYSANLLLAQVRSLAKRNQNNPALNGAALDYPGISLDPATRTATIHAGESLPLTRLEFRLLYTLMTSPGQVFLPECLIEHVWGYDGEGSRNLVRGLIKRLRAKIEPDPLEPRFLLTQPGGGYYFNKCQYWEGAEAGAIAQEQARVLGWV